MVLNAMCYFFLRHGVYYTDCTSLAAVCCVVGLESGTQQGRLLL